MSVRLLAGLLIVLLVGCASKSTTTDNNDEPGKRSTLSALQSSVDLKVAWRTQLGEGPGRQYSRIELAVVDDTVYTVSVDGGVYALSLSNGRTQWRQRMSVPITGGITYDNGVLYVTTRDGRLHALSAEDGASQWSARLTSEAIAPVGVDSRRVFVQTVDGRITAFERSDGRQAWTYEHAMPILTLRGTSAPLVLDQFVIAGFSTGRVMALDKALGIPRWDARLATADGRSELERLIDVDGTPRWHNGMIYAASYNGDVAAIGLNGDIRWQEEGSSYGSPEIAMGSLYLTLDDSRIRAYDLLNGASQWQQTALKGRELTQVTAINTYLAVADHEGYVHLLRQFDGDLVGRLLIPRRPIHVSFPNQTEATNWRALRDRDFGVRSRLVATDRGLLVYTNSGELLLLSLHPRG